MRVYIIKAKGGDWFGNYRDVHVQTLVGGEKIYVGECYYRLKDAKARMKSLGIEEYSEIARFDVVNK